MTVALRAYQIEPATATVLFLESERMLDLTKLESCKLVIFIAAAVMRA